MAPVVEISPDGILHVGRARVSLARRFDQGPSRWVIYVPDESPWSPLKWVVNLALNGSQKGLREGIRDGISAGNSEVYVDALDGPEQQANLAAQWTRATGLPPGPRPMLLGVSFIDHELVVPLQYLRDIYELLATEAAP